MGRKYIIWKIVCALLLYYAIQSTIKLVSKKSENSMYTRFKNTNNYFAKYNTSSIQNSEPDASSLPITDHEQNKLTLEEVESQRQSQIIQDINCDKIFQGDEKLISKFNNKLPKSLPSDKTILEHTKNCELFRQVYGYNDIINTQEEKDFPLAFNILFYKEVAQVEMLLRSIYRPQNSYCLHVDGFSSVLVHRAARSLADCFHNVFIVSKTENIVYKSFQRLQADINCMADHLKLENGWKYLINLPGEEFPIKTHHEIVKILKELNGRNVIECKRTKKLDFRYEFKYENKYTTNGRYIVVNTKLQNSPPPHNTEVIKGSAYGVFTREFVQYVVHNQTAKDLLNWSRSVLSPDEYFWSMLNWNLHLKVPGSVTGVEHVFQLSTYVTWQIGRHTAKCHGIWVRFICVFQLGDLKHLVTRHELFANKFQWKTSYSTLQCLSRWLTKMNQQSQQLNLSYYRLLRRSGE